MERNYLQKKILGLCELAYKIPLPKIFPACGRVRETFRGDKTHLPILFFPGLWPGSEKSSPLQNTPFKIFPGHRPGPRRALPQNTPSYFFSRPQAGSEKSWGETLVSEHLTLTLTLTTHLKIPLSHFLSSCRVVEAPAWLSWNTPGYPEAYQVALGLRLNLMMVSCHETNIQLPLN